MHSPDSPKSGNLYVANLPSDDIGRAGVYRMDDAGEPGAPACVAVKIAEVERPTALAFGADGTLYVTSLRDSTSNDSDDGSLLKLIGVQ